MSSYTAINRPIEHGQRIELGDMKRAEVSFRSGEQVWLHGVEDGSERESYVVVEIHLDDGGELSLHPSDTVLDIGERQRNAASLWILRSTGAFA